MRGLRTSCAAVALAFVTQGARAMELPFDLPPVDATGALTYSMTEDKAPGSSERIWRNLVTATVSPTTYIIAPWFATINGTLSLTVGTETGVDTANTMLTGNIGLSVMPASAYPLEIEYSRYNSAVPNGTDQVENLTGQNFRLNNRLFLPDEWSVKTNLRAWSNANDDEQSTTGREAEIGVSKRLEHHEVDLTLGYSDYDLLDKDALTEAGSAVSAVVRYRSEPFEDVTSDNTTSIRLSSFTAPDYEETSNVLQGVGTSFWRPKDWPDLTVFVATRTYQQQTEVLLLDTNTKEISNNQTAFANLAASYIVMPRMTLSGGVNAGYLVDELETSAGTTGQSGFTGGGDINLDYTSERTDLWGLDYSWMAGAASRLDVEPDESELMETVRLGQTLGTSFDLPLLGPMNFSLGQTLGVGHSTVRGAGVTVSHNVNLGQSLREGKNWSYINFSAYDSRTFGDQPYSTQLLNIQYTQGYDPDRYTSIAGSLSVQLTAATGLDDEEEEDAGGWTDTITAEVMFAQREVFGFENLTFQSRLLLNPPSTFASKKYDYSGYATTKSSSDLNLGSQRWTNRLDYMLGKLRLSLIGTLRNGDAGMGDSLMLQLSRQFF